jgi:hypothetical protein
MSWNRAILIPLLPLLALLGACEGGIRGSGISTSLIGNVVSVDGSASVAGVRVQVAGKSARTDAAGGFSVVGPFDGMLTVRFTVSGSGTAQLPINVPAAGLLTLNNVHVDTASGTATPESQDVDFDGVVVSTDCAAATMVMDSAVQPPGDVDHYTVDLATSTIQNAHGQAIPCEAVADGASATLSGHVEPNGDFGRAVIVVTD